MSNKFYSIIEDFRAKVDEFNRLFLEFTKLKNEKVKYEYGLGVTSIIPSFEKIFDNLSLIEIFPDMDQSECSDLIEKMDDFKKNYSSFFDNYAHPSINLHFDYLLLNIEHFSDRLYFYQLKLEFQDQDKYEFRLENLGGIFFLKYVDKNREDYEVYHTNNCWDRLNPNEVTLERRDFKEAASLKQPFVTKNNLLEISYKGENRFSIKVIK